jgi:AcrR family transcriptional regulator
LRRSGASLLPADFDVSLTNMKVAQATRPYRMSSRAEAAAATGERILDATEALFLAGPVDRMTLEAIAARAAVTVQTVIRRYGSKDGLIEAAAERAAERVRRQRAEAPIGDVAGAVTNLLDHYEAMGEHSLRLLAEEDASPTMREIAANGRDLHRRWVERTFAPQLAGRRGAGRARRMAQNSAITDVYTWKLLRRDAGLSRAQVEQAVRELIEGLERL